MRRDVFQAIADPVRREIIDLLVASPQTVNEVASKFEVSRPAISKHLKILQECGIVEVSQKGRERYCHIKAESLVPAFMWIEQYQQLWEKRLDNFEQYLNKLNKKANESDQ